MNKYILHSKSGLLKTIFVVFLLLSLCLLAFLIYKKSYQNTVYITNEGFVHAGIKVYKGETVKFVSKTNSPFWIASDPHPTHTNFSDFDSGKAIEKYYQFKFDKVGVYRYHDHINPDFRGVVSVVDKNSNVTNENCSNLNNLYEKKECFLNVLIEIQNNKGDIRALEYGFEIVKDNQDLSEECHNMAHVLGEYGYWRYSKTKKLIKSNLVSFCGFGYVHGFVQELAHHQSNFVGESKKYCDYFSKNIIYDNQNWEIPPEDTCYNGIGHGVLFLYLTQFENDLKSLVETSSQKCIQINPEKNAVDHCFQGVFSGVSSLFLGSHGYKKEIDTKDPFWLCRQFDTEFNSLCFANMVPAVGIVFNRDLEKMLSSIRTQDATQTKKAIFLVGDIAANWYSLNYINLKDAVNACSKLYGEIKLACFSGLVSGLARTDKDTSDLVEINICNSSSLGWQQKNQCKISYLTELKTVSNTAYYALFNNLSPFDKKLMNEKY